MPFPGGKLSNYHKSRGVSHPAAHTLLFLAGCVSSREPALRFMWGRCPFHSPSLRARAPHPQGSLAPFSPAATSPPQRPYHHVALIFPRCCTAFDGSQGLWDQAQSFTEQSRASTIQHDLPFPAELPFSSSVLQTLCFPVFVPLLTLVPSRQVSSHTDHNDSSSRDPAEAILPLPIRPSLTLQTVGTFDPGRPSAPCLQSLWTSHRSMMETISDGRLHPRVYQAGTCALWMLHTLGRIGVARTQPGAEVPTNAGLCVLFQSLLRLIHTLTDFTPRRSCEAGTITTPVFH